MYKQPYAQDLAKAKVDPCVRYYNIRTELLITGPYKTYIWVQVNEPRRFLPNAMRKNKPFVGNDNYMLVYMLVGTNYKTQVKIRINNYLWICL